MKKLLSLVLFLLITSLTLSQQMNPDAAKHYNQGNDELKMGKFQEAIKSYDEALKHDNDYRIHYQKAMALKRLGKNDESLPVLNKVIELNPKFDGGYNALGTSYFALNKMEDAIKSFEKVVEVSTNNNTKTKAKEYISRCYAKLGSNLIETGDLDKAIPLLLKGVENFNFDAAYLSLARAYYENGEYAKSIEAAGNANKYRSSIPKGGPFYYMGLAYKKMGDITKARENLNQAKTDNTYKKIAEYELQLLK